MGDENGTPAAQGESQGQQNTEPQATQPAGRTFTQEDVDRIVSRRIAQERGKLEQMVKQYQLQGQGTQYAGTGQQPQQGADEDDETFFRRIVAEEVQRHTAPISKDFQRAQAKEQLATYFASKGNVPEDVRQEIEQVYMEGVIEQGLAGQVTLQDVVRGVVGRRMEERFFQQASEAARSNTAAEQAGKTAQAEGGNTAPPQTEGKRFEDLKVEEMEAELADKGFDFSQ